MHFNLSKHKAFSCISSKSNLSKFISKILTPSFFIRALFVFSLIAIICVNINSGNRPVLDRHGFRQTQTALTSYYLKKDGFRLDYETPVIGKGYSIPFEFPIYQEIVAKISDLLNSPLDQTGKNISLIFALFTCFPIFFTLKKINVKQNAIFYALALYLSSPIYMYWSGTFMIESTALFFSWCFLYYGTLLFLRERSNYNLTLFAVFLLLALLQKITTALPILLILITLILLSSVKFSDFKVNGKSLLKLSLSFIAPIAIAYLWIKYTDLIKNGNLIGQALNSNSLAGWNFGSVQQRFSKDLWVNTILERNISKSSFSFFGVIFIILALLKFQAENISRIIYVSLALFVLPFFVFTNLHIVHDYYQSSNSVFWTTGLGIAIYYLCEPYAKKHKLVYFFILTVFIFSNYAFYAYYYFKDKTSEINIMNNRTLKLADFIKSHTPTSQPIIIYGYDWSSELAYYSERKSLTLPWQRWDIEAIENTEKFLKDEKPSAIVLCPVSNQNEIRVAINKKYPITEMTKIQDCEVYFFPVK